MSKKDKLLERLQSLPSDFRFEELQTLLQQLGFTQIKTNAGSHFKWKNMEKNILYAAPRKNPMKIIYLKQLIEIIEIHFNI